MVLQTLILALAAEHGVERFQQLLEGKLFVFKREPPGFDAGYIQNVIDEPQQVLGGGSDLLQILAGFLRRIRVVQGNAVQTDDGVHGCADLMAHVGQECGFRFAGLLRSHQRITESLLLLHGVAGVGVHVHKAGAHAVDLLPVLITCALNPGKADGLKAFAPVTLYHIGMGNDAMPLQPFTDGVRLDEAQKLLPVRIRDILIGIGSHSGEIRKMLPDLKAWRIQIRVFLIADARILIQLQIINTPIVGSQRGDHLVLLLPMPFLLQQLFLQRKTVLQLLLLYTVRRFGGLLFQQESAVSFGLPDDKAEHHQHRRDGQGGLDDAPPDGSF